MSQEGERGSSTGGDSVINSDPKNRKEIEEALEKVQKMIGEDGYRICTRRGFGISGNARTTIPFYVADLCMYGMGCDVPKEKCPLGLNNNRRI